ncbi:MAG: hypothetical protein AM326_06400 [Candidatus Thorarchaeota archaeon SMTZ-45]|nr:MAG: hypothetical protein AM325_00125 [Candidatus Thorarchaeota archaeon SMTZ1-45]KXH76873.1 MAG: hypothetical protein AM326_06400 [Candidatus Thorarchaeota archaeon SMTZ-45]
MVSRETEFGIGGAFVLASIIPIGIALLGNFPTLNPGLIVNFGLTGVVIGFIGFYLIGTALFRS